MGGKNLSVGGMVMVAMGMVDMVIIDEVKIMVNKGPDFWNLSVEAGDFLFRPWADNHFSTVVVIDMDMEWTRDNIKIVMLNIIESITHGLFMVIIADSDNGEGHSILFAMFNEVIFHLLFYEMSQCFRSVRKAEFLS